MKDKIKRCYLCKRWFWKDKLTVVECDGIYSTIHICEKCVAKLDTGVKELKG